MNNKLANFIIVLDNSLSNPCSADVTDNLDESTYLGPVDLISGGPDVPDLMSNLALILLDPSGKKHNNFLIKKKYMFRYIIYALKKNCRK